MGFSDIAYYNVFGIPLLVYGGMLTLILLLATATAGWLVMKGKVKFSFHKILAIITIIIAFGHGLLAFASRFMG